MHRWLAAAAALTALAAAAQGAPAPAAASRGTHTVTEFGAVGDGTADDTAAFQRALDTVAADGGGIVQVPTGNFNIKGHLSVPDHVTLEGVFRAPTARTQMHGSTLLATEGRGKPDGEPFLFLHANSTLKGITVYYPQQDPKTPSPYPWCVRGAGDNCSVVDVLLVNPWQAVDFGTFPCGRHLIRGLYAQALKTGVFVDKCYDVGRIEDVHLWPFWDENAMAFTAREGAAFRFARTDWEFVSGCFCIAYAVGFQFVALKDGPGNVVIMNSGSDVGPKAVLVEDSQGHAGIVWTNCQFMASVEVRESNNGPVKFNNCGFWAGGEHVTTSHALLRGKGQVTFNECHFTNWDHRKTGAAAIEAEAGGLTVTACDFMDAGKRQVRVGPQVRSAIVTSNRMRGGVRVENRIAKRAVITANSPD